MEKKLMNQAIEAPGNARSIIKSSGRAFPKVERGAKYASIYARIGGSLAQLQSNNETLADQVERELKNPEGAAIHQLASEEMKNPSKKMGKPSSKMRGEVISDNGQRLFQRAVKGETALEVGGSGLGTKNLDKFAKSPTQPTTHPIKKEPKSVMKREKTPTDLRSRSGTSSVSTFNNVRLDPGGPQTVSKPGGSVFALNAEKRNGLSNAGSLKRAYVLRPTKKAIPVQVSRALAQIVSQGGGNTTLKLNPNSLGSVHVDIQLKYGVANVALRADNEMARKLLTSHIMSLRAALEKTGVVVENLQVFQTESQADKSLPDHDATDERAAMANLPNSKDHREDRDEHRSEREGQNSAEQMDALHGESHVENQLHRSITGEWRLDTFG
jgi:flagellar hook-length control protein FliK